MTQYLSYNFDDTSDLIETFDELPLWSAPFGLLLLKHLELKPGITVVDIGSGAGFPLMELAGRLGSSCTLFGVDPWANANSRARKKIKNYGYSNVTLIESPAEKMLFENATIDLIVSNLGINNFEKPDRVFKECHRILKPSGKLALTTNLNGHWKEFYKVFENALKQVGKTNLLANLNEHQAHRGSVESTSKLFSENGFRVTRHFEESFEMRFVDGSAFLNHHFVKVGWLGSWKNLLPKEDLLELFTIIEQNLNSYAKQNGGLTLTVPMAFIEGGKGL